MSAQLVMDVALALSRAGDHDNPRRL